MKNSIIIIFIFCFFLNLRSQVTEQWIQRYNGTDNGTDQANSTVVDAAGNIYVSGTSAGTGTGPDIVMIKYNPVNGDTIWVNRYAGASSDQVNAMTCDNNAVYAAGWSFNPGRDIITIKYDAVTGNRLWVKTFNGAIGGGDYGFAIAVDPSGNVYVTGRSDVGGAQKFTTLKYDASGNMAPGWPSVYSGVLSTIFDESHAVKVDAAGNVYVTGRSGAPGAIDFLTIKMDASGIVQWTKKYNGSMNNEDNTVALVIDNASANIFVAGSTVRTAGMFDYIIIKYAASNGDSVGSAIYNGPPSSHDFINSMAIDNSNNIYVTGLSWSNTGGYDFATVKYNSLCQQQWVQRYNGPGIGTDAANSIAVDALGNVYVTGYSFGSGTGDDYAAISYSSAGVQNWVQRYNGPANGTDAANSLAVDNSGNVYVTGWSAGSGTGTFDFATLRYRQLPNGPSGLTALADFSRRINLAWTDNSNNEDGFKIERSIDGGANWSLLTSLPLNAVSYVDTGLTPNSIYHYRVNAFNSFGNSPYSNSAFDTAKSSDPIDYINLLISMINTLKNNGILNHGQATSLITKLNSAVFMIEHDHIVLAKIHMYAFIIHVYVFRTCGILNSQQAQPLIDASYDVIQILCEMDSPTTNNNAETPKEFALHNNFPNPFNPFTKISYDVPKTANVKIAIFDVLGREVAVLVNEKLEPGHYAAVFDGTNYSSGVYFYRLETEYYTKTRKMVLMK